MGRHLIDVHHIRVFVVHVEQVDLVGQNAAVEAALLHQHDVEAQRIGVDRGRAQQPEVLSPQMISVCTPSWVRWATRGVPKNTLARCLVMTTSCGCGLNSGRMA